MGIAGGYVYSKSERNRNIAMSVAFSLFLVILFIDTVIEVCCCLSMISSIEKEKMQ